MKLFHLPLVLSACLLVGCGGCRTQPRVPDDPAAERASASLALGKGRVLLDNDAAFESKLALIDAATESIDLAYYIIDNDYSSSVLAEALLAAAARGVRIRLITDYSAAYAHLDWFSMLEQAGDGRLSVRFYNRPTRHMIKDAAYVTLGCTDATEERGDCSPEKFAAIEQAFADEAAAGGDGDIAVSNLSVAGSGDFLAGLYGRNPELMALAVQEGQGVDPAALRGGAATDPSSQESLKRLGRIWLRARYGGGLDALQARIQLAFARSVYGEQINPVYDALSSYMPVDRADNAGARRDWDYQSEFLHHKLLWVDGRALQLGGRNVQDSYHMHPGELTAKYVFNDTDLVATVDSGGKQVTAAFEQLWQFRAMVAGLDEVRAHAPNDSLAALKAHNAAVEFCAPRPDSERDICVAAEFASRLQTLDERLAGERARTATHAERYHAEYRPRSPASRQPAFDIDPGATVSYVENLPFYQGQRGYGAEDAAPDARGKHIHGLWLDALARTCAMATPEQPLDVVFHNAYFLLPANLLRRLGEMLDGSRDCGHVTISVVTNSFETTDLNAVNLAAAWQLKALDEHRRAHAGAAGAAGFRYLEYQARPDAPLLSLHSKVMLFGDALFIGSANADVRSFILDTNNGLYLEDVPTLVSEWQAWLAGQQSAGNTLDVTAELTTEQDALMRASLASVGELVTKYDRKGRISSAQQEDINARARELFDRVYSLSQAVLDGDDKAADTFNSLLKPI